MYMFVAQFHFDPSIFTRKHAIFNAILIDFLTLARKAVQTFQNYVLSWIYISICMCIHIHVHAHMCYIYIHVFYT